MKEIRCSFRGCSCGCTDPESKTFQGNEPDIYIKIANWAQNYLTDSTNPFSKLNIPQESKDILLKIIDINNNIEKLKEENEEISKINKSIQKSSEILEIEIPQNKIEEIKKGNEKINLNTQKIVELRLQRKKLLN